MQHQSNDIRAQGRQPAFRKDPSSSSHCTASGPQPAASGATSLGGGDSRAGSHASASTSQVRRVALALTLTLGVSKTAADQCSERTDHQLRRMVFPPIELKNGQLSIRNSGSICAHLKLVLTVVSRYPSTVQETSANKVSQPNLMLWPAGSILGRVAAAAVG